MNKVILMGRLTANPELRTTQSGIASCRFTIAIDRKYADKNTGERQADFISCTAWRETANFVTKYFTKGKMIAIEGELRNNNFQDKTHPDVTHYNTDVLVDQVHFCGDKANGSQATTPPQQAPQQPAPQYSHHSALEEGMSYGNLSDFEEILSGGDLPF